MEEMNIYTHDGKPEEDVLLAYIRGIASDEENAEVEKWLREDHAHEKTLMQIAATYFAQYTSKRIACRDPLYAYTQVQQKIKRQRRRLWIGRIAMGAACVAGIGGISTMLSYRINKSIDTQPHIITVQSNVGMRTHFSLPDGTVVYLNSGSTLAYPAMYDSNERRVTLSGEAFFKVASDACRPFVVNVFNNEMSIKALGTEFNVEAYEADAVIHTTLVEGSVKILLNNGDAVMREQTLAPSEKAIYHRTQKRLNIQAIDTKYDTAWMDGKVIFKDTPLPEVLRKLSHFYNVEFSVQDTVIEGYLFTGTFNNRQLSQVLDYLSFSSRIDYRFIYSTEDDSKEVNQGKVVLNKRK
jgi:ferric-dicitrate binding protein FerR (iron transport regulator)